MRLKTSSVQSDIINTVHVKSFSERTRTVNTQFISPCIWQAFYTHARSCDVRCAILDRRSKLNARRVRHRYGWFRRRINSHRHLPTSSTRVMRMFIRHNLFSTQTEVMIISSRLDTIVHTDDVRTCIIAAIDEHGGRP